MKPRKNLITWDDWDLTRGQLESQRHAAIINLDTLEAAIFHCECERDKLPKPKLPDTDEEGDPVTLKHGKARLPLTKQQLKVAKQHENS